MKRFDEGGVHSSMLGWLESIGWKAWGEPEKDLWGSSKLDEEYDRKTDDVIYWQILKEKIIELNDKIDENEAGDVIESLKRDLSAENLVEGNKKFYKILRNGKKHTLGPEYDNETIRVRLIAHPDDPEYDYTLDQNRFDAVTEFQVEIKARVRPDIVLFINGIPFINVELKSSAQDATVEDAIRDMRNYERKEPRLFIPSLLNAVCDGKIFKYAAVGASEKFYFPWYSDDFQEEEYQPKNAVESLFNPETLMDIFRYFVFYEGNGVKIVPRFMQYYATNLILDRIKKGEPRKGLIWHTQGSGKSYTMLFAAYKGKKSPRIEDKQYLLIVDRKKLDEQMADTLAAIDFPAYAVAEDIEDLGKLLSENKSQLILTTIHKFGGIDEKLDADVDLETVVMVDEAHRFQERKLGSKLKNAISNDYYFGFTGTPVREGDNDKDRNTFQEFSPEGEGYLHRYSLKEGERDGVITEVTFTLKNIPWDIPEETKMDLEFEGTFQDKDPDERREILRKYVNQTELTELRQRLEKVVADIYEHLDTNLKPNNFKGMVVTPSRRAAALYGEELEKYLDPQEVQVVISSSGEDDEVVQRHYLSDHEERQLIKNFKTEENPKLLVVCYKLLTGFDAPILKSLYLDKEMKNHTLLQAIARTNRPMDGKENGEIVDYAGVFVNPDEVLEYEDVEFVKKVAKNTDELVDEFLDKLDELMSFFKDIEFDNDPETLQKCVVKLKKNPIQGERFEKLYKEAENKYESVSPHAKLGEKEIEKKWAIVSQIYRDYKSRDDHITLSDDVRSKTKAILEKYIEFEEIGPGEKVEYELPEREVKMVKEDVDPDYKVIDESGKMRATYRRNENKNPIYQTLSERVKQVMERWRHDELTPKEALKELENIDEKENKMKSEKEERKLNDVEFSLYHLLTRKYNDFVASSEEAEELAKSLGEEVKDLSLKGNLSQIKRDLRGTLIKNLAKKNKKIDLIKYNNRSFLDDSIQYIVANTE